MESSHLLSLLLAVALAAVVQAHWQGGHDPGHGYSRHPHGGKPHGDFYKPIDVRYGKPPPSYKPASSYEHGYGDSYDEPKYEEPSYEIPKYEPPKYELPTYEVPPIYEAPKYEAPTYEPPKHEAPTYHAPKYEAPKPSYAKPKPIKYKTKGECTFRGQYLPDPSNKCAFRRCVVQSEPWEVYGEIPLDIITLMCAPGSAVSRDYRGGESNPCTEFDKSCGVPATSYKHPKPSYKPPTKYQAPTYQAPKAEPRYKPNGDCKARGMHLADPADKCRYRRCVVQSEPWEQYGEIPLDIISLPCPPGTAVPSNYAGGYDSPCVQFDDSCGASKPHSYPPPQPPKTYADPPKMTYETPKPPKSSYPPPSPSYEPAPTMSYKPTPKYEAPKPAPKYRANGECKARGMHLADPADKCKYRRCVVQSEPWEEYGEIPLDIISLPCPPGTSVPHNYAGGYDSPCVEFDESCGVQAPQSYPVPEPPKSYSDPPTPSYPAPKPPKPSYPSYDPVPTMNYKPAPKYEAPKNDVPTYDAPQPSPKYKTNEKCKARGMHLADPADKCKYRRCVVQSEPWEQYGQIPLDIISLPCPPGTSVPSSYTGGYDTPCTEFDDSCGAPAPHSYPAPAPSYDAAPTYAPEPTYAPVSYSPPKLESAPAPHSYSAPEPPRPSYPALAPSYEPASSYDPEPTYAPAKSKGECKARGMHLQDPTNKCMYRRCVVQSEPWEEYGKIPLDIISRPCPPGTSVPSNYAGGYDSPCTEFDDSCGSHSYPMQKSYPVLQEEGKLTYDEYDAPGNEAPETYLETLEPVEQEIVELSYLQKVVPTYPPKEEEENVVEPTYPPIEEETPEPTYPPIEVEEQPVQEIRGCKHRGELLRNPADKCSYIRCIVGDEPWQVAGDIPLTMISQSCAMGSAVPEYHTAGIENPCTVQDAECITRREESNEVDEKYE